MLYHETNINNINSINNMFNTLFNDIYNNMDTFYGSAASAKNMRVEEVMFGMSGTPGLKLHPGAIRAHEERGVSIPAKYK